MADIYVRSTDGSDADNGSTWALAKATLAGAAAIDAAGDTIYLSQSHAESTAAGITIALAGTYASPTRILCANDSSAPPTAQASSAIVATTGSSNIWFSGSCYVIDGVTFSPSTGTASNSVNFASSTNAVVTLKNCTVDVINTGSGARIDFTSVQSLITVENLSFRFGNAGQGFRVNSNAYIKWNVGTLLSGGVSPTTLILPTAACNLDISGLDLRNASASINLISAGQPMRGVYKNWSLPASWSGAFVTGTIIHVVERHEFYNCDSADTNYRIHVKDYAGTLNEETTIVRTGGATDGTTPLSWRVVTTANAKETPAPFITPSISVWNETTATAKTVTVEIVHDSLTALTDAEVWVEVEYLGTSGVPLGAIITDQRADILGSAANQATSTETWTTTGLTNPNKQKLSVTFTPQEKGWITARIFVGKASYTIYVDPEITVT